MNTQHTNYPHVFELLHPIHRLLDFWCGRPQPKSDSGFVPSETKADWDDTQVQLHPQLQTAKIKNIFLNHIKTQQPLSLAALLEGPVTDISPTTANWLESTEIACLLPLFEGPQPWPVLARTWATIHPANPVNLEVSEALTTQAGLRTFLARLEKFAYVFMS